MSYAIIFLIFIEAHSTAIFRFNIQKLNKLGDMILKVCCIRHLPPQVTKYYITTTQFNYFDVTKLLRFCSSNLSAIIIGEWTA